ncbi:MAG: amidohydrolase family protein [Verrucomicrobia bacterium]|nr:amidohydrolase family protein [Verrucomicrobiota bacterium]
MKIIDAHLHNWNEYADVNRMLRCMDRCGVERGALLGPLIGGACPATEEVDASNSRTLEFMRAAPGRFFGFCYVNPRHPEHARESFRRCAEDGFAGLKLWVATFCDDPRVFPLVEMAIERQTPILVHTWLKATGNLEFESAPEHAARLASRYPDGKFIMAHIGGDFEIGIKTIRHLSNVWVDYAGTPNEWGVYEMAVSELGEDRVVFGSDGPANFWCNYGRVLESDISEAAREKILALNFIRLLPDPLRPREVSPQTDPPVCGGRR